MEFDRVVGVLGAVVFAPLVFYYFKIWFSALRFYRERNWNFGIDSEYTDLAKWGDAAPNDGGTRASDRTRVIYMLPFMAFGSVF
jgi:hypothetical protein